MFTHKTTSNEQAKRLAFLFAKEIIKSKFSKKSALIIALSGNLGSGKTTFVQGFLRGAGIKKKITSPTFVLIKTYKLTNLKTIIKGDEKIPAISLASIVAKVYRDKLMKKLHKKYPRYDFIHNVGYGTKKHIKAIKKHGPSAIHRRSFKLK